MNSCTVVMKDGKKYIGPLWEFRPKDGWFALVLDPEHYAWPVPDRIRFADVETAVEFGVQVTRFRREDVDLLRRAREEGWNGA